MNTYKEIIKEGVKTLKLSFRLYIVLSICIITSIFSFLLANKTSLPYIYVYNDEAETKRLTKIKTLSVPVLNYGTLLNNVDQALFETFNFNSSNYSMKLESALSKWYTKQGAKDLYNNLTGLNGQGDSFIDFLVTNRISSEAYILPGTGIIRQTIRDGRTAWHIGARMLLTYRNQFGYSRSEEVDVSIWVVVINPRENPNAIGIRSLRIM